MPRPTALALACVLLASQAAHPAPAAGSKPPNVLIMVADDLGFSDVGFNGSKEIRTPNLDKLASTGIKLNDFRSCPMCSPTRAGLMTGRWPLRFGVMRSVIPPWSANGMPAAEKTIAELLAPAGYEARGLIGKWHLGHAKKEFLPLAQGFTSFYGHYNGAIHYFDHTREGETDWHRNERSIKEEGYSTDLFGTEAARFIQNAPEGKPWLLYLAFNAPHSPFRAKPEDIERYKSLQPEDRRIYAAMVDSMDQAIGKTLDAVEKRADATNTLVLFFSDNGGVPKVGRNQPWRGYKLTVYEGGTRVCAAIRWPAGGLAGGKGFDGRIGYIDVLPTLLAAAGLAAPDNLDGINFLPAINGKGPLPDRPWFTYYHQADEALASVHKGPWKLIARGDFFAADPQTAPSLELYNLQQDPRETRNVRAENSDLAQTLLRELKQFGKLRSGEGESYGAAPAGFKAPKDWLIE